MKVRYFEKRGNTWADFRVGGARKRMDTGARWGDQRGAEAAMPGLIARAMREQEDGANQGPSSAPIVPHGQQMQKGNHPSLEQAFRKAMKVREQWIKAKDKKTLEQTFEAIIDSTKDSSKLRLAKDSSMGLFTRDFVRELRALWLQEPGKRKGTTLSASTINHRLSMLSVLLEVCDLPPHTVKHLSTKGNRRKRRVTDDEVRRGQTWLTANHHLKGALDMVDLITVALDVGARQGELLDVPWQRIDLETRTIQFDDTKNGETRVVPIPDASLVVLERRRKTHKGGPFHCLDQDRVTALWDAMRAGIGLEEDEQFVFHILRHEFGSRLADKGTNAFVIMALMGHDDISTTQVYVKASLGAMMQAQGVGIYGKQPVH